MKQEPVILVVDDSKFMREVIKVELSALPFAIIEAESAEEAIPLLKKYPVALITLDMMMRGMNGLEASAVIKKQYPSLPIIMCSSMVYEKSVEEAYASGASSFVKKPFEAGVLKAEVLNKL